MTLNQLQSHLNINYNIKAEIISKINAGVENENYLVEYENKKYVLRIYNSSHSIRGVRNLESIERELEFVSKAVLLGIPAPKVIRANNSSNITYIQSNNLHRFAVLFTFLKGKSPKTFDKKVTQEFGYIVNSMYEVGSSFNSKMGPSKSIDIITRMFNSLKDYKGILPTEITLLIGTVQEWYKSIDLYDLRKGLVHGDLKLENILFNELGTISGVLDFDDYRYSYLLEEATMSLMHNLHSSKENIIRAGYYNVFMNTIKNKSLSRETEHLRNFLRVRFVYDMCKYFASGNHKLAQELIEDLNVQKYILE